MASTALADIWDEPIINTSPRTTTRSVHGHDNGEDGGDNSPRPTKRPRSTLFLESDDEAPKPPSPKATGPTQEHPDIDSLFDDLDDDPEHAFQDLAPSLDLDALRRQADVVNARSLPLAPHEVLPSSSPSKDADGNAVGQGGKKGENGRKERKKIPRLDEARLLGPDGFPALIKQTKNFRPKGKGHEALDLNRLLQVYQFWTHKMYPRTQFRDTTQRVEKFCHSKRMQYALRTWRDESKGIFPDRPADETIDLTSDAEHDSEGEGDAERAKANDAPSGEAQEQSVRLPAPAATNSPRVRLNSTIDVPDDDFDIDAMIREDEEQRAAAASLALNSQSSAARGATLDITDEDEAMWDELGAFADEPALPPQSSSPAPVQAPDDDEEMWDIVREMEAEAAAQHAQGSGAPVRNATPSDASPSQLQDSRQATNEEGWDEMYA
ncbi:replication fork protection component Swi3-domain-containing protein [Sparassis latifolia]